MIESSFIEFDIQEIVNSKSCIVTCPRSDKPFVVVECSGLTESLFESELFGHERGAFTGAHARKIGLLEATEGGTLFLDEIGDVPLSLQVKLLRLLETGTYRRVGSIDAQQAPMRAGCMRTA